MKSTIEVHLFVSGAKVIEHKTYPSSNNAVKNSHNLKGSTKEVVDSLENIIQFVKGFEAGQSATP